MSALELGWLVQNFRCNVFLWTLFRVISGVYQNSNHPWKNLPLQNHYVKVFHSRYHKPPFNHQMKLHIPKHFPVSLPPQLTCTICQGFLNHNFRARKILYLWPSTRAYLANNTVPSNEHFDLVHGIYIWWTEIWNGGRRHWKPIRALTGYLCLIFKQYFSSTCLDVEV